MSSEQMWVEATYLMEVDVISTSIEFVVALPDVDHLLLIDD